VLYRFCRLNSWIGTKRMNYLSSSAIVRPALIAWRRLHHRIEPARLQDSPANDHQQDRGDHPDDGHSPPASRPADDDGARREQVAQIVVADQRVYMSIHDEMTFHVKLIH
jgi:hypothetical protein